MNFPLPPPLIAAVRALSRRRLANVTETVGMISDVAVIGAAAPFAPTAYSRARLVRQMHASGLLCGEDVDVDNRRRADASEAEAAGEPRTG